MFWPIYTMLQHAAHFCHLCAILFGHSEDHNSLTYDFTITVVCVQIQDMLYRLEQQS